MTRPPCPYERHRATDWTFRDRSGVIVCGICHPPLTHDPATIVTRGDPDFDKAAARHRRAAKKTTTPAKRAKPARAPSPSVPTEPTGQDALDF